MPQTFRDIPDTLDLTSSRPRIVERDEALRSSFAGPVFPQASPVDGQPAPVDGQVAYRDDLARYFGRVAGAWQQLGLLADTFVVRATQTSLAALDPVGLNYATDQRAATLGRETAGDGGGGIWRWAPAATDAAGPGVVRPSVGAASQGSNPGRWLLVAATPRVVLAASATPSVAGIAFAVTSGATAITDFTGAAEGQRFVVERGDQDVTIVHNANLIDNGGRDVRLTLASPRVEYIYASGVFRLLGGDFQRDDALARLGAVAREADVAALRGRTWGASAAPDLVILAQNFFAGDGGGLLRRRSGDSSTVDDGVRVIVDASGNRWERLFSQSVPGGAAQISPSGSVDVTAGLQAIVAAAGGRPVDLPVGRFLTSGVTAALPLHLRGVGTGAGPGAAAQANSNVTQLLLSTATARAVDVTSPHPSVIENVQINVTPSARPQTAGGGIRLQSPAVDNTFANAKIRNVGVTNAFRGVEFVRPAWPTRDGVYVDGWVDAAFHDTTSPQAEGLGGFIRGAFLFGESGSTTQGAALYSEIGYTTITDAAIIGGRYGLDWSIKNHPAGAHRMGLVQIENSGLAGSRYRTQDGTLGSMVHQLGVEYSNVEFAGAMVADVLVEAHSAAWLDTVAFQSAIHRNLIPTNNTAFSYYDVRSGAGVRIDHPIIHHLTGSSPTARVVKVGPQASRVFVNNPLFFGAPMTTPYELTAQTTLLDLVNGLTVAQLPVAANGSLVWVSDARAGTSPVEAGGAGALCVRQGGAWHAIANNRTVRVDSASTPQFVLQNPDTGGAGFEITYQQSPGVNVHRLRSAYESGQWTWRLMRDAGDLIRFGDDGLDAVRLRAAVSPANANELVVERTSNTTLTFKLRGSDNTVRTATLTLA